MKISLLLTTLLLSTSPAVTDDFLYLKFDETMELSTVIDYGDGDKTTLRRDAKKTIVLRIDTRNKKLIVDDAIE